MFKIRILLFPTTFTIAVLLIFLSQAGEGTWFDSTYGMVSEEGTAHA